MPSFPHEDTVESRADLTAERIQVGGERSAGVARGKESGQL